MGTEAKLTPTEKARKTLLLRGYHKATLDRIDHDVVYRPKRFYTPHGKDTKHINVFPSELQLGRDIYTEKINSNYDSEDDSRTLYKWPYEPNWADIYTTVKKEGENTISWYLIPVSELKVVEKVEITDSVLELNDPNLDLPLDQITIRDVFAILHKKPVSQKKWLNELITKTK